MKNAQSFNVQNCFICGAKSIGQYGGYETFIENLTLYHSENNSIKYYIACKANGDGCVDENKLSSITQIKNNLFKHNNALCFKFNVPPIGPAQAIYYDFVALSYFIDYCLKNNISHPIFYVLTCRIGPFMRYLRKKIDKVNGRIFVNPDGHEWKREKWPVPVRKYWKFSERLMVKYADLLICDSKNIEKYIKSEYESYKPNTTFIPYGANTTPSELLDNDDRYVRWLAKNKLSPKEYYLIVGRLVPENSYETIISEFMNSKTSKDLAIVCTGNNKLFNQLEKRLNFQNDKRIKFVGPLYDSQLLKKIRENAYGYIHGHTVGGTNPSLLEALASTDLNLLVDVKFNKEVADAAALYWNKNSGNLAELINSVDNMSCQQINGFSSKAKKRIDEIYNWQLIADQYEKIWEDKF